MNKLLVSLCITAGVSVTAATAEIAPTDVMGDWAPPGGDSIISIADCGDGTPCGKISWLASDPNGEFIDEENADPELRNRPLVGMVMLQKFKKHSSGWRRGEIYDPGSGKTYRAKISRASKDTLEVKGCVGPFCQSQNWSLAADDMVTPAAVTDTQDSQNTQDSQE
ncbi:MAG: DUF2147 domain-containing protein [Pseudomonadota bacterium]